MKTAGIILWDSALLARLDSSEHLNYIDQLTAAVHERNQLLFRIKALIEHLYEEFPDQLLTGTTAECIVELRDLQRAHDKFKKKPTNNQDKEVQE